jgi:hypothetical protein
MNKKQQSDYESLRDIWYKKLKDAGFEDIERDETQLKVYSSFKFGKKRGQLQHGGGEFKEAYYYMATHFLNDYKFDNEVEKIVWSLHTEAVSVANITKYLHAHKIAKTNRQYVWEMVKKLEDLMKKLYLPSIKK